MTAPRMRSWGLTALLVLGLPCAVHAQVIVGRALEEGTNQPVPGTGIRALDAQGRVAGAVVTDSTGAFRIVLSRPGAYRLRTQHPQFAELLSEPVNVGTSEAVAVDVLLGRTVIPLEPLVVVGRGPQVRDGHDFYRRRAEQQRRMGLGRHFTREDIAETSVASVADFLKRDIRVDVTMPPLGGIGHEALRIRDRGVLCFPMLYLNGMRLGRSDAVDISAMVDIEDVESIELYRSRMETPVDIADNCGAIAVWSGATGSPGNPFTLGRILKAAGFVGLVLVVR